MAGYRLTTPNPSGKRKRSGGTGRSRRVGGALRSQQRTGHRQRPRALAEQRFAEASTPADRLAVSYSYVRSALTKQNADPRDIDRAARLLMQVGHRSYARSRKPAREIQHRRAMRRSSSRR